MYQKINILRKVVTNRVVYFLSSLINLVQFILYSTKINQKHQKLEKMIEEFDSLEKISVFFGPGATNPPYHRMLEKINCIQTNEIEIIRRIVGLKYRLRGENGGMDPTRVTAQQMDEFIEKAESWARGQKILNSFSKTELRELLHEAGNYSEFVSILLKDSNLQDSFFAWVIRDHIDASIFIEYPALQKRIVESNLHIRVGHFKRPGLNIRQEGSKFVTLLMEGKEVNILDGNQTVTFRGNWTLTIDEILHIFKSKTHFAGNLEYMEEGIVNWNVFEWGYWDDEQKKLIEFDFEQKDWHYQLPIFQRLSNQEASRKLGHALDGRNWGVSARASRKHLNMNLFENHAFIELFFPHPDGLGYSTLPLGKYAKSIPSSAVESLAMLCSMAPATISFIDENIFYTFREQAQYGFTMTSEEGKRLFEMVKEDIKSGKKGHFVYQIETENCAKWVQETLVTVLGEENVPNLYKTFFLETEAEGGLGWMMKILRLFPKKWQPWLVTRFHIPLGAFKGSWIERHGMIHWVSLMTHPFWRDGIIYFPAFLHQQLKRGSIIVQKVISYANLLFRKFLINILGVNTHLIILNRGPIQYRIDKVGQAVFRTPQQKR